MKCEPWMNYAPVARRTPLQMARDDMHHWKSEMERAQRRLDECRKQFEAAVDKVARL
jgi:hypothetical protein